MRICLLAAFTALLTLALGCNSEPSPVAVSTTPAIPTSVGPVPGAVSPPATWTNPYAGNQMAMQDGWRLFNWYNCSGCHGGHGGGGMGPSLRRPNKIFGNRDDQIFSSIAEGRGKGMPAWGTKIPEDQIWQLVTYIKSMRTLQEPDPPTEPTNEQVPNPENNDHIGIGPQ
ncbi:MAG TPA: c-type cytochrome [Acidobacteriaceae bacterium]|jgi:cytochrome c oxidase cbb3-type subunit 3|nr:c-type cytochrome [Acidobacteriaceae bacterium]